MEPIDEYPITLQHPESGPQEVWNPSQEARAALLGWTRPIAEAALPVAAVPMPPETPKRGGWPKGKPRKAHA